MMQPPCKSAECSRDTVKYISKICATEEHCPACLAGAPGMGSLGSTACLPQKHGKLHNHPSAEQRARSEPQTLRGVGISLRKGCAGQEGRGRPSIAQWSPVVTR